MKRLTRTLLGSAVVVLIGAGLAVAGGPAGSESFPGENGKIAFTRGFENGDTEVCVMDVDGSSQTRLTNSPDSGNASRAPAERDDVVGRRWSGVGQG